MNGGSIRVLHVDDEPDFADLVTTYLEREDERFDVETATSAAEGLDRLAATDYDCVVSDYDMPRTDGIEFLERVREDDPDLPFVLFTGKGSEEVASEAIRAGVTDYLQKGRGPSQYELLANRVRNAVESYRAERRARLQEREYRRLFENAPVMYALIRDKEGGAVIEDCNDRFVETLGYEREELVGNLILDHYTDDSIERMYAESAYQRAREDGIAGEERTLVTKDGERIEALACTSPRLDVDGNVIGTQTIYLDVTERKQREEELELYETIVETVPDGVYALDDDLTYLAVNEARAALSGCTKEELIGSHISKINSREAVEMAKRDRKRFIEEGNADEVHVTEHTYISADGEEVPCEVRFRALPPDDDGSFRGTAGVIRDVSDRKEYEQGLEEYREYADRILDSIDDVLIVHDDEGYLQRWNESLVEVTGFFDEEVASMHALDFLPEEYRDRGVAAMEEVFETSHVRLEAPLVTKDGETIPYEYAVTRVEHPNGDSRFVGIGRDISERERRERQLRTERDRLAALFEDAPRPIIEGRIGTDEHHRYVDANRAFEEIFGYERDEIVGQDASLLVPDDGRDEHERLRERVTAGESVSVEVERTTADGERVFLLDVIPYGTDSLPADGAFARYTDVTERREYERELERQNDRLERFASVVSHDLRNPLRVAEGNVELAGVECDSDHLDTAAEALDRMDALIEDLLTLAREGDTVTEPEPVVLAAVVDECWQTVDTADATLRVETDPTIRADQSRLRQLLENLVRNAIEHGGEDVTITIGDLADGRGFYVEDDGPGIPADERDGIFAYGHSTADEGTGFGLAIVDEIAAAHGWDITVTESDAGGARFEITGVEHA